MNKEWSPERRSTENGFVTETFYFNDDKHPIKNLKDKLDGCIKKYFQNYSNSNDLFITKKPNDYFLYGWGVFLKDQGIQKSHNHNSGWLSGVLYLDIPNNIKNNEGSIDFSLHGYDYPIIKKNIPHKTIRPSNNTLLLFPSSIFHKTIPFSSDNERISLAFDLVEN